MTFGTSGTIVYGYMVGLILCDRWVSGRRMHTHVYVCARCDSIVPKESRTDIQQNCFVHYYHSHDLMTVSFVSGHSIEYSKYVTLGSGWFCLINGWVRLTRF